MRRRRLIAATVVAVSVIVGIREVRAQSAPVNVFTNYLVSPTPISVKTVVLVNGNGAVAGSASVPGSPHLRSFIWTLTDGYVDPGTLGASSATIVGLSDDRSAAGNSALADGGPTRAFTWSKEKRRICESGGRCRRRAGLVDLGTLGGDFAAAASINNRGWIVGRSALGGPSGDERPFLWTPSDGMTDLCASGCPFGARYKNGATDVSDSGIVVGYAFSGIYTPDSGVYHAAIWDTVAQTLTVLFQEVESIYRPWYSIADSVTESGWVAGRVSETPDFRRPTGFVWSAATGVRIVAGRVTDVNEDGWATAVGGADHGWILRPGEPDVDLGPIATDLPFFVLDNHVVVGHARDDQGFTRAFYWEPQSASRHEIGDAMQSSIAQDHAGQLFVGSITSYDEVFIPTEDRQFVWDGAVRSLTTGFPSSFGPPVGIRIGNSGHIAASWTDGSQADYQKVWAPPLPLAFTGFLGNLNPWPEFNSARAGSQIRVRFGLSGAPGPEVMKWGYPRLVDCDTASQPEDTSEFPANLAPAPPVRFRKGSQTYVVEMNVDPSLTCAVLQFKFVDNSERRINFTFQ